MVALTRQFWEEQDFIQEASGKDENAFQEEIFWTNVDEQLDFDASLRTQMLSRRTAVSPGWGQRSADEGTTYMLQSVVHVFST